MSEFVELPSGRISTPYEGYLTWKIEAEKAKQALSACQQEGGLLWDAWHKDLVERGFLDKEADRFIEICLLNQQAALEEQEQDA